MATAAESRVEHLLRQFVSRQLQGSGTQTISQRTFDEVVKPMMPQLAIIMRTENAAENAQTQQELERRMPAFVESMMVRGHGRQGPSAEESV